MRKIALSPLVFDDIGTQDAAKKVLVLAKNRQGGFVVTPNSVMAMHAIESLSFSSLLQKAALTLPDGGEEILFTGEVSVKAKM